MGNLIAGTCNRKFGFYWLARRLFNRVTKCVVSNLSDSYDVRMKEWRNTALLDPHLIDWVQGDIADRDLVGSLIDEVRPDAVINLATCAGVRQSIENPSIYYETNVIGTLNLLEVCKDAGVS